MIDQQEQHQSAPEEKQKGKGQHGGARQGAGRKRGTPRTGRTVRLDDEIWEQLGVICPNVPLHEAAAKLLQAAVKAKRIQEGEMLREKYREPQLTVQRPDGSEATCTKTQLEAAERPLVVLFRNFRDEYKKSGTTQDRDFALALEMVLDVLYDSFSLNGGQKPLPTCMDLEA